MVKYRSLILLSLVVILTSMDMNVRVIRDDHTKIIERNLYKHYKSKDLSLDHSQLRLDSSSKGSGCLLPIVYTPKDSILGYLSYRKANACKFGGCSDTVCTTDDVGFKEYIYYFVILSRDTLIEKVRVLEYESSYGYEISNRGWLNQFNDKKPGGFVVKENVDAISGATISVEAMVDDINSIELKN